MSKTTRLISVVIPTYNRYDLCTRAIQSVRAQTYEPLQIIVVEDGSNSGIAQYIRELNDPRLLYQCHKTQQGLPVARNIGVENADGDYIAFLDDDDEFLPKKIALQVEVLASCPDDKCLGYCGAYRVSNGQIRGEHVPTARGSMADHIFKGYLLPESCMMLSRAALLEVGGFSEDLVSCIDHDLWMKLAMAGFSMDFVSQPLVRINHAHDPCRMTSRLDQRLSGIGQFFEKWKPVVVAERGFDCWKAIEKVYYHQTIPPIRGQYLSGTITKWEALTYMRRLISLQSESFHWLDYFAFQIGLLRFIPLKNKWDKVASWISKGVK